MTNRITGDKAHDVAVELSVKPQYVYVPKARLAKKDDVINASPRSGKALGSLVLTDGLKTGADAKVLVMAQGSSPTDPWVVLGADKKETDPAKLNHIVPK